MDDSAQVVNPVVPTDSPMGDELERLQKKISSVTIPVDLQNLLTARLERLTLLKKSLSMTYVTELQATSTYISWITQMPWNLVTKDLLDLNLAKQVLDKNHYGLEGVKDRILEYLSALMLNVQNHQEHHLLRAPILCLVGLAGTGKTTLALSIAQALGRRFERIPFGGIGDTKVLRGQSKAHPDAEPGIVIKKLVRTGSKNCVILLDELDRVSVEARSDVMGVLIELLDPEQNSSFTDHYIDYPFDLSQVLFIATANNTTNISTAVLDRLELIQMPSYSDEEKVTIGKKYLFPKIRSDTGLTQAQITISDTLWPTIIRPLGFDSGIRSLERTIGGICRKSARLIVEKKAQNVQITDKNIREFLPTF